ncbi:MAG: N-acetylmuramoyl-L-alanine amidase [Firmicutes bacterium]|nr:N-acetylmuramoyl-L-alanine amidase [Bacillota bacterium]
MENSTNQKRIGLIIAFVLLFLFSPFTGAELFSWPAAAAPPVDKPAQGNTLLGVARTSDQGRLSYDLIINGDFTYNSFLLAEPERLVIDLTGVELDPALSTAELTGGPVKGVRVSRFDHNTVRVVFDLEYLVGYKLKRQTSAPGGLRLDFNVVLKDIGFQLVSSVPEIYVETSGPVQYRVDYLLNPHRLLIDLWDVTLTGPALTVPGNDTWVKSIRVSQFDPKTIRLVLDIKEPRNCVVGIDETNPARLLIRTITELQEATWLPDGGGGRLVLKSAGRLPGEPRYDPNTGKLYIRIPQTKLGAELQAATGADSIFRLREPEPSTVEVELTIPRGHDYSVSWNQDRRVMTVEVKNAPLSGKVIILDPGHGGADVGAISPKGLREKELNLAVAVRLKQKLEDLGAEVLLTREDDRYLWLYDRVALANRAGGAVLLSIHANNHDNRKIHGLEIWYHPDRSECAVLAEALADAVLARTNQHFRGIMSSKDFVLPREAQMPAVIFEMGFISNQEEEKLLLSEEFQDKIIDGISQGLIAYFQTPVGQ